MKRKKMKPRSVEDRLAKSIAARRKKEPSPEQQLRDSLGKRTMRYGETI